MVNLWPWMKNVLGWKNSSWKTLSLPFALQRYERQKGSRDLQLNSCRVQLSGWHWHSASLPQYCGMSRACTPYLSPGTPQKPLTHFYGVFFAFCLQVILVNFNYIVSAMMLAPLGFLYVMCSSKMQKIFMLGWSDCTMLVPATEQAVN